MSLARTLGRSLPSLVARRTLLTTTTTRLAASSISRRAMSSSESIAVPTDFNKVLYTSLAEQDPEVAELIEKETWRQFSGLESVLTLSCSSSAGWSTAPGAAAEPKPPDPLSDGS